MIDHPHMPTQAAPPPEQLARYANDFNQSLALKHFGAKISFPTTDRVHIDIDPIRVEHLGGMGSDVVNGGVLAAAFDLALGCTGALVNPRLRNATTQLSMTFERPVRGKKLRVEAWINSAGKLLLFSGAELFDENDQLCARGTAVVRLTDKPWNNGHSPVVY